MNIGIIANKLNIDGGGSNHSLDLLAKSLNERGFEISVITVNVTGDNTVPNSVSYPIYPEEVNGRTPYHTFRSVMEILRNQEDCYDIYHIFDPFLIPTAGYYRKKGGNTPVIGRLNSYSLFCSNSTEMNGSCHSNCNVFNKYKHDNVSLQKKVNKIPQYIFQNSLSVPLAKNIDQFFAQSPAVSNIYSEIGLDENKIETIPNFVDHEYDLDEIPNPDGRKTDVLFVGRLEHGKGADLLVETLDRIDRKDLTVKIAGDGPQFKKLSDYGMDCIELLGWVPHAELPKLYADSKIIVHPARWPDPCPRVILEALQHFCIPIVSNIGGPPWMIGESGHKFEPGNDRELQSILLEVLKNPIEHFDVEGFDAALSKFSNENILSQITTCYRRFQ